MTTNDLTWNTALLYPAPDSPQLETELASFETLAADFRDRYFEKIAELEPAAILAALREYEAMQVSMSKAFCYAHLLFADDSGNGIYLALSQRCSELGNRLSQQLLFFDLELMNLEDDRFDALCALPDAAEYVHFLTGIRKFRPYTLKENEERLLTRKELTGMRAFVKLFDELSASFNYRMELDGTERDFTGEELLSLLHHTSADVRFRAFTTFLEKHGENGIVYNAVFNNMALDHGQEMELRGYTSPIQPTNIGNEIPDEAVEHLMAVTESNYGLAQEYFRLKAKMLGMDKLRNTDVYAPVVESERTYDFDEARDMVVTSYAAYDPDFGRIVGAFFDERRVDVMPRVGKSGGAFAMGISPEAPPFLLLNYTGTLRDLATIAHEAGHGLHFILSQKQSMLNYHAPLPLAETASVFGEMLLTRALLDKESDPTVRRSLLCAKIEDIIATTFRQTVLDPLRTASARRTQERPALQRPHRRDLAGGERQAVRRCSRDDPGLHVGLELHQPLHPQPLLLLLLHLRRTAGAGPVPEVSRRWGELQAGLPPAAGIGWGAVAGRHGPPGRHRHHRRVISGRRGMTSLEG